jgi:hypothetical protein
MRTRRRTSFWNRHHSQCGFNSGACQRGTSRGECVHTGCAQSLSKEVSLRRVSHSSRSLA